jgi:type IV pilus assembly protein PilE
MHGKAGFTLIELMITVAIIAVLVGIAYPSYRSYIVRNNRGAAQAALMDIAQRQQQYLADMRSYASTVAVLNVTLPANVTQNYTVSIATTAGPPPTFTASAAPVSGSPQVNDGTLSIDQAGTKSPANKW